MTLSLALLESQCETFSPKTEKPCSARTKANDLVVRTKSGAGRPLLDGDASKTLQSLSDQRSAWYEEVATVRIDTRGKSVTKVCSAVLEAIHAGANNE